MRYTPFLIQLADIWSNGWIYQQEFEVYIRKSRRGEFRYLDVATVNVYPKFQRQGHLSRILDICEAYAIGAADYVFVENVIAPWFHDYLRRRGYEETHMQDLVPEVKCFQFKVPVPKHGLHWK